MIVDRPVTEILFDMEIGELEHKLGLQVYLYMADYTRIAKEY